MKKNTCDVRFFLFLNICFLVLFVSSAFAESRNNSSVAQHESGFRTAQIQRNLIDAIKAGNIEHIKAALASGISPDMVVDNDIALLHTAILYKQPEIATLIIHAGADVNRRTTKSWTPLFSAIDSVGLTKLLIRSGAKPNIQDTDGLTPLAMAVKKNNFAVVETLVKMGAGVNGRIMSEGFTPLMVAVNANNSAMAKLLLSLGAAINAQLQDGVLAGNTSLMLAARTNKPGMVKLLIDAGANKDIKDAKNCTALEIAEKLKYGEIVKLLQSEIRAVKEIMDEIYNLFEHGKDDTPQLGQEAFTKVFTVVKKAIDEGLAVNQPYPGNGDTLLHWSSCAGSTDITAFLLTRRASVNARNARGETPLMFAASCDIDGSTLSVAQKLLSAGADANARDSDGESALNRLAINQQIYFLIRKAGGRRKVSPMGFILACQEGTADFIDDFLADGGDLNESFKGITGLMFAAASGHESALNALVKAGANLNMTDSRGMTALHYAALKNKGAAMELLKQAGARVNILDKSRNTAGYYLYWGHGQNSAVAASYGYTEPRDKERRKAASQKAFNETLAAFGQGMRAAMAEAQNVSRQSQNSMLQQYQQQAMKSGEKDGDCGTAASDEQIKVLLGQNNSNRKASTSPSSTEQSGQNAYWLVEYIGFDNLPYFSSRRSITMGSRIKETFTEGSQLDFSNQRRLVWGPGTLKDAEIAKEQIIKAYQDKPIWWVIRSTAKTPSQGEKPFNSVDYHMNSKQFKVGLTLEAPADADVARARYQKLLWGPGTLSEAQKHRSSFSH